eukprot:11219787-Lingulodinium_polyedra.AAC.1
MLYTVVEACTRWNCELSGNCCCGFHASIDILNNICRDLASVSCVPDFDPASVRQCQQCGLLAWNGAEASSAH